MSSLSSKKQSKSKQVVSHPEKIKWMRAWCKKSKLKLVLNGECGFGRACVGVSSNGIYPDYIWHDDQGKRLDDNGEVWTPDNAYHKHPCVAVLGLGDTAEAQLYDWLQWFEQNKFTLEVNFEVNKLPDTGWSGFEKVFGNHLEVRLVKSK